MHKLHRPYPTHEVTRSPRHTRAVVVVASGLTYDEAREAARDLRDADPEHRYGLRMMTLEAQADAIVAADAVGPDGSTLRTDDLPPLPACDECGGDTAVRLDAGGLREAFCPMCVARAARPATVHTLHIRRAA